MEDITDGKVIALAINALKIKRFDRILKTIVVKPETRLSLFGGTGWKVFFIYEEADEFLNTTLTVEVSSNGESEVFLSL